VLCLDGPDAATLAGELETYLFYKGCDAFVLDETRLRDGLNEDLDQSLGSLSEQLRRTAETAKLFAGAGLMVIVPFVETSEAKQTAMDSIFSEKAIACCTITLDGGVTENGKPALRIDRTDSKGPMVCLSIAVVREVATADGAKTDRPWREPCLEVILDLLQQNGIIS
jgi:hypothetical protein